MKIIGLAGPAGSGKDTACEFALEWCKTHGLDAERLAFADPLKISAAAAFGIPRDRALEWCNWLKQPGVFVTAELKEGSGYMPAACSGVSGKRVSGRQLLQFYGTEGHRDVFGSDFWVEVTERKLNERAGNLDVVFLTDPRFDNEAAMIYKHEGELWHIERPQTESVEAHSSEAGLAWALRDTGLNNGGTLEDLQAKVYSLCETRLAAV